MKAMKTSGGASGWYAWHVLKTGARSTTVWHTQSIGIISSTMAMCYLERQQAT